MSVKFMPFGLLVRSAKIAYELLVLLVFSGPVDSLAGLVRSLELYIY